MPKIFGHHLGTVEVAPKAMAYQQREENLTRMQVPKQLDLILRRDNRLHDSILTLLNGLEPRLIDSKSVFFPEYNEHGASHIQEVLDSAEGLIPALARSIIGPEDVATLVVAALVETCAITLTEDSFSALIRNSSVPSGPLEIKSWRVLWSEFVAQARRFDEPKLKVLFGDTGSLRIPLPGLSTPMTRKDRILVAEFLRPHLGRLAGEIALGAGPALEDLDLSLDDLPPEIRALTSVVASSGNLELRESVDNLNRQEKGSARRKSRIHLTYLMAVLRVAHYVKINRERPSDDAPRIRALKSPPVRGKFTAHSAVKYLFMGDDDPEVIWVEATPEDVHTFLQLKSLIADIQKELDSCWAVLGEVYGSRTDQRDLGLSVRRIKSNLDDVEAFSKKVHYVPRRIKIDSSPSDLVKLLIHPLYGNHPEIAIRELLQNALDACRELKEHLSADPTSSAPDLTDQSSDVEIRLESRADGTKWMVVSDKGIGMTAGTIADYFLKAGASLRTSPAWRNEFEDAGGNSRVLRSGHFGIGVLAAFLLGDEIRVSTRHVSAKRERGLSFTFRLGDEAIQLEFAGRPVGATIQVPLTDAVFSTLRDMLDQKPQMARDNWDWYCLDSPSVSRVLLPEASPVEQKYRLPGVDSDLPAEWRRLYHPSFRDIHWTYSAEAPSLVSNGLVIIDHAIDMGSKRWRIYSGYGLKLPKVSVFDADAALPLDLLKQRVTTAVYPFEAQLVVDVIRDVLAYLLVFAPEQYPDLNALEAECRLMHYDGSESELTWCWYSTAGTSLLTPWHVEAMGAPDLILADIRLRTNLSGLLDGEKLRPLAIIDKTVGLGRPPDRTIGINSLFSFTAEGGVVGRLRLTPQVSGMRVITTQPAPPTADCALEWQDANRWLWITGDCPPFDLDIARLPSEVSHEPEAALTICYFSPEKYDGDLSVLAQVWQELMDLPYIPYRRDERRHKLSRAYEELSEHIRAWETIQSREPHHEA
jgi:molecular chaperone HtpG